MLRNPVSDSLHRPRQLAVVLARNTALRNGMIAHLARLNCVAECAATLAEAQLLAGRHRPQFVFIECSQYPLRVREVAALICESIGDGHPRPFLIGLGGEHCPTCKPGACGLDEFVRSPPTLMDVEALFELQLPNAGTMKNAESETAFGCQGLSILDPMAQLPKELQIAMLQAFVDDTATRLERIEASLKEYDFRQARRDVHAIKSGCLQIGFTTMAECCDQLREAIHANDCCGAQRCYRALVAAFHAVASHLPRS